MEWQIKSAINPDSEIYFNENFIGIKNQNGSTENLPGQKTYKVIDNDYEENTVTLVDDEGNRYKFDQDELSKALAENTKANGFQALQYPCSYLITTSGTILPQLSIYDGRLKGKKLGQGKGQKMVS
jgi:hypothetical protein